MAALAYDAAGAGEPPLLLLHGWCCDRTFLAPQFEHFAARHRVVAVDLPGHGASDPPADASTPVSIEALAAPVAALTSGLGLAAAVLVGHSMGSLVALALARRVPGLVGAIVMLDPPTLDPAAAQRLAARVVPSFAGPDDAAARRRFVEGMFLPTDAPALRSRIVDAMCAVPDALAVPLLRAMAAFDAIAALAACEVPVLSIGSAAPSNASAFLREVRPGITVGQTVGSGHFLQLEVPEQVNPMIERFLALEFGTR